MSVPRTGDVLEPITVHGVTYDVVDDSIIIPTRVGDCVVTLDTDKPRKDWTYSINYQKRHFTHACIENLLCALEMLVRKEDVLRA